MNINRITLPLTTLILLIPLAVSSSTQDITSKQDAFKLANSVIGKKIGDYRLTDQDGKSFGLKDFAGKPIIINFVYTDCGHICPTITMSLGKAIKEAGKDFGTTFNAVTIGFDIDNDTPHRMNEYGRSFTDDFGNWKFVTADKETMRRITDDFGFFYKKIPGGFDHLNAVTIVDSKGSIYKHVYGINLSPREILDPLYQSMKTVEGESAGKRYSDLEFYEIFTSIKLLCYDYDESTGTYKFSYTLLILRLVELIIVLGIIYSIWAKGIKSLFLRIFRKKALSHK
ncbi:MAG: SCO family protein [Nitrospirota bacterium]